MTTTVTTKTGDYDGTCHQYCLLLVAIPGVAAIMMVLTFVAASFCILRVQLHDKK